MPTAAEHRSSCDAFVAHVHLLCAEPGVRARLSRGRGLPVEECAHGPLPVPAHRAPHRAPRRLHRREPHCGGRAPGPHPGVRPTRTTTPASSAWKTILASSSSPRPITAGSGGLVARPNLGATLATAVRKAGHGAERTEDLLSVLTRLSDDQLHRRLPAPVTRLLKEGITPDWGVLLHDLVQRPHQRDQVGLRWRDAFYLATPEPRRP
ncbi:type I-E CRISPR-associated protein Cse2/CasB [Streptomyces sp. INA 01156]